MSKSVSESSFGRRNFLRLITALTGVAATSILDGCIPASEKQDIQATRTRIPETPSTVQAISPIQTSTPEAEEPVETSVLPSATAAEIVQNGEALVAFVKTNDRAEGVRRAIELLGINPVKDRRVFLKPNFNSADPTPGSTHLDVLATLVTTLRAMGAGQIAVGDRSGMGNTRSVMQQVGVFKLADEIGFDTLVLDELKAEDWVMIQPSGSHWENGFPFAKPCLEAEALVQTCCLKTHRYGGQFTLSLKNAVGMAGKQPPGMNHNFMQELHGSADQRRMIAEINTAYTPALIVLDGVEAFISGGPDAGERVSPGVILAGTDRIAVDAVGVALLRYFGCKTEVARGKIFAQDQIARAVELELGVDRPEKIKFLTGDQDSAAYCEKIQEVLLRG